MTSHARIYSQKEILERRIERMKGPRVCKVEGRLAIFHRWVDEDTALLSFNALMKPEQQRAVHERFLCEGLLDGCCTMEKLHRVLALVEYADDGTVTTVPVQNVRFIQTGEV